MKAQLDPVVLATIKRLYFAARGREARKVVVEHAAATYGMSYSAMHRRLELNLRRREPSKTQREQVDLRNQLAKAVWQTQQFYSKDDKRHTIRSAFRLMQSTGQLPGWFTEKMAYDGIERQHLRNLEVQSYCRFERAHPHSMFQADFTKSNYLRYAGNGVVVITDGRWTRGEDDLYVWIGGAIDDRTRVVFYEYIITHGENAAIVQQFLINVMVEKPGMMLLQGKPRELYVDRGPGFDAQSTEPGLTRIGVKMIRGDDFRDARGRSLGKTNKQARGKIEKFNGFVKTDFEQELRGKFGAGHKFTLTELNARLAEWCEWQNQQEHPEHRDEGKWQVFETALPTCSFALPFDIAKFGRSAIATVRRRLVRVGRSKYFRVPEFIDEGAHVEITERGADAYLVYRGSEIKLVPQVSPYTEPSKASAHGSGQGTRQDTYHRQKPLVAAEQSADVLLGIQLKDRFDDELRRLTNGELGIQNLLPTEKAQLTAFFQHARTLEAVCAEAVAVKLRAANQESIVHSNPKIIIYQP